MSDFERVGSGFDRDAVGYEAQGRDAAPDLTLVMPFYRNCGMLALQYEGWAAWPDKLKRRTEIVLVDDGSPEPAADVARPEGLPALRIYRVTEDRPWHQHAARNLGARAAVEGWMLLTDMDHVLTADAARSLFKAMDKGRLDAGRIYMLDRAEADTGLPTLGKDGRPKPHPNSFVVTRETYWRIGGYDEDLCGIYGTDSAFRHRAFSRARKGHLSIPLVRFWRDLVADASTNAPRKEGRTPGDKEKVLASKAARGEADTVKVMQFEWERVL
jgi:hypothetical protein